MIDVNPHIVHQCGQQAVAAYHLQLLAEENRVVMVTTVRCHSCRVSARKEVGTPVSPRNPRFRKHGPKLEVPW